MAKYLQEPVSLRDFETQPTRSPFRRPATAARAESPTDAPSAPRRVGIRERSHAESWARGLLLMGVGLAALALMNTAAAVLLGTPLTRPVLSWIGAVLVLVGSRRAAAAVRTSSERPSAPPAPAFWRPGVEWVAAGLAVFFLLPQVARILG